MLQIKSKGKRYGLHRSEVHHRVWNMYEVGGQVKTRDPIALAGATVPLLPAGRGKPVASIGVYVDDFLFSGSRDPLHALNLALKGHVGIWGAICPRRWGSARHLHF